MLIKRTKELENLNRPMQRDWINNQSISYEERQGCFSDLVYRVLKEFSLTIH